MSKTLTYRKKEFTILFKLKPVVTTNPHVKKFLVLKNKNKKTVI